MAYLKCELYIPDEDKCNLIEALNKEGFLYDDGYDSVFAESPVIGHFTPLSTSNPNIGDIGDHTTVKEAKLEFRVKEVDKDRVFKTIKENHPYEVPVINFIKLV